MFASFRTFALTARSGFGMLSVLRGSTRDQSFIARGSEGNAHDFGTV